MKLRHIDTCLPDFFNGSDLPYLQVVVDGNTTLGDIKSMLKNKVRNDAISNEETEIDENELRSAIDNICSVADNDKIFDDGLDIMDDDATSFVYAYFVIDLND